MRTLLLILLAFNAGYVDAAGFLALHGLFTTHITGNFVTLGAGMVLGTSGILAKILALPLFCAVILLARLAGGFFDRRGWPGLRIFFVIQIAFLGLAALLGQRLGPFPDGDAPPALAMGGLLVTAMAIQNAVHRVRLTKMPPSTAMTGTTTQVMVDLADLVSGLPPDKKAVVTARLKPMAISLAAFATGCGLGALAYFFSGELSFVMAPVVALAATAIDESRPE